MRTRPRPGIADGTLLEGDVTVHGGGRKVNDVYVFGVFLLHFVFTLRRVGRLKLEGKCICSAQAILSPEPRQPRHVMQDTKIKEGKHEMNERL